MDFATLNKLKPLEAERAAYAEKRKFARGIYRTDDAWLCKGFFYASYLEKAPRDAIGVADAVALINQLKRYGQPDISADDLKELVKTGNIPLPECWDFVLVWSRRILSNAINDKKRYGAFQSICITR